MLLRSFRQLILNADPFALLRYYLMGGIQVANMTGVTLQMDGTIEFSDNMKAWPRRSDGSVLECLYIADSSNITITSSHKGVVQGNGDTWWGIPGVGYLEREENRPRLVVMYNSKDVSSRSLVTFLCT